MQKNNVTQVKINSWFKKALKTRHRGKLSEPDKGLFNFKQQYYNL